MYTVLEGLHHIGHKTHSENRNILFDEITRDIPNFLTQANKEKIISILTSQNMNVLLSLAKFIVKAWG